MQTMRMVSTPAADSQVSRRQQSPNVIFMICDDLGYGDLGCYGSKLPTPNLDAAAARCSESAVVLGTGRPPLRGSIHSRTRNLE